jgi:glycosyltransferase involved in cell wall biosynthesis
MIISYCSQIKNRFHQFAETFEHNLEKIKKHENTEWIIVDCNSDDGVREFMQKFIESENISRIHYYLTLNYDQYSIPVAKNFSARLSSGDYIFNLDVDNFIADTTEVITEKGDVGIYCNVTNQGLYGRLGFSRSVFEKVGGYDESFFPAGKHDTDIRLRCELLGYNFENVVCNKPALLNSKEDTIKNMNSELSWKKMNFENTCKMHGNLTRNIYCPNKKFTTCELIKNFKHNVLLEEHKFYANPK